MRIGNLDLQDYKQPPQHPPVTEIPKAIQRMINEQPKYAKLISVTMHPNVMQRLEEHYEPLLIFGVTDTKAEPKICGVQINVSIYLAEHQVLFHFINGSMQFLRVQT